MCNFVQQRLCGKDWASCFLECASSGKGCTSAHTCPAALVRALSKSILCQVFFAQNLSKEVTMFVCVWAKSFTRLVIRPDYAVHNRRQSVLASSMATPREGVIHHAVGVCVCVSSTVHRAHSLVDCGCASSSGKTQLTRPSEHQPQQGRLRCARFVSFRGPRRVPLYRDGFSSLQNADSESGDPCLSFELTVQVLILERLEMTPKFCVNSSAVPVSCVFRQRAKLLHQSRQKWPAAPAHHPRSRKRIII